MKILVPIAALLIVFGSGMALGDGGGDGGDNGFCQYGQDGIAGKYALSGLEGCTISVYSAETHLLDITYKADHIELYFQIMDDAVLKKETA